MVNQRLRLCRRVTLALLPVPAMSWLQTQLVNREVYGCGGVLIPTADNLSAVHSWRRGALAMP